jgi:hypothetical protein
MSAEATCAICGRTILAGERVHGFAEGGVARTICELCLARAEQLGWRPAGEPEPERSGGAPAGRWRLGGLLRRGPRRAGAASPGPAPAPRRPHPAPPREADAPSPFERAVARFNSSDADHTVAGPTRTLGRPWVSVGAAAGAAEEIRITVAWELSWYQWGVDIGDELRPVFQIGKGRELSQLDAAARQWNAAVDEQGHLSLAREAAGNR